MDLRPPRREETPCRTQSSRPEKVRILWDERQITDVLHRYSRGFDRCDVSYDRPLKVTRERTDVVAS